MKSPSKPAGSTRCTGLHPESRGQGALRGHGQLSLADGIPELPGPRRERETGREINSASQTPREGWQGWGRGSRHCCAQRNSRSSTCSRDRESRWDKCRIRGEKCKKKKKQEKVPWKHHRSTLFLIVNYNLEISCRQTLHNFNDVKVDNKKRHVHGFTNKRNDMQNVLPASCMYYTISVTWLNLSLTFYHLSFKTL